MLSLRNTSNLDSIRQYVGIDQSLQLSLLSHLAANYLNAGWEAKRYGTAHASIVPYQAFTCQDGEQIIVAAANDQFFKELCSVSCVYQRTSSDVVALFLDHWFTKFGQQ